MEATHQVAPQETGEAVGGKNKRGRPAPGTGGQLPVGVGGGSAHPLIELVDARRIGSIGVISNDGGCDHSRKDSEYDHNRASGHKPELYLSPPITLCQLNSSKNAV